MRRVFGFGCAAIAVSSCMNGAGGTSNLATFLQQNVGIEKYRAAAFDLNGDGTDEHLIYAEDADFCGTGGCALFVISETAGSYRVVGRTTIVNPPIKVLDAVHNGWHDLSVTARVDAFTRHVSRLPFDGERYAGNPTVPPASKLDRPEGTTLIAR